MRLTARCYAKLNLGLAVYGPRADGFHDIATVFQAISLADELVLRPAPDDLWRLTIAPADVLPADDSNLVLRAARALEAAVGGGRPRAHFHLVKRVPHAAGLGGGSSDAAATLRLLARHWSLSRTAATHRLLHDVAASLGSDVPFFLRGGTAIGSGRGEILQPCTAVRRAWFVVAVPGFGISTREAYERVDWHLTPPDLVSTFAATLERCGGDLCAALHDTPSGLFNSFESTLFVAYPQLAALTRRLREAGAVAAALSGSGSAVFAVAASAAEARHLESACTAAGLRAFRARPVSTGSSIEREDDGTQAVIQQL